MDVANAILTEHTFLNHFQVDISGSGRKCNKWEAMTHNQVNTDVLCTIITMTHNSIEKQGYTFGEYCGVANSRIHHQVINLQNTGTNNDAGDKSPNVDEKRRISGVNKQ